MIPELAQPQGEPSTRRLNPGDRAIASGTEVRIGRWRASSRGAFEAGAANEGPFAHSFDSSHGFLAPSRAALNRYRSPADHPAADSHTAHGLSRPTWKPAQRSSS